jgi:hypothetical protein
LSLIHPPVNTIFFFVPPSPFTTAAVEFTPAASPAAALPLVLSSPTVTTDTAMSDKAMGIPIDRYDHGLSAETAVDDRSADRAMEYRFMMYIFFYISYFSLS